MNATTFISLIDSQFDIESDFQKCCKKLNVKSGLFLERKERRKLHKIKSSETYKYKKTSNRNILKFKK